MYSVASALAGAAPSGGPPTEATVARLSRRAAAGATRRRGRRRSLSGGRGLTRPSVRDTPSVTHARRSQRSAGGAWAPAALSGARCSNDFAVWASRFPASLEGLPKDGLVERQLGDQGLELLVLVAELLELPDFAHAEVAEPAFPAVERGLGHAELAARVDRGRAGLGLAQGGDDLLIGEPAGARGLLRLLRWGRASALSERGARRSRIRGAPPRAGVDPDRVRRGDRAAQRQTFEGERAVSACLSGAHRGAHDRTIGALSGPIASLPARMPPLQHNDLALLASRPSAFQAGCRGFEPRLPLL